MNRKQQEAKKYLSQAFGLNQRIESKLNQIEELHNLAAKVTAAYSDMPKSPNRDGSRMEDTVCRIIDLESEINQDMLWLVELKKGIVRRIKAVENTELQMVLELRYLSYMRWEEIAIELGYGIDNVFRLHGKPLRKSKFLKQYSKIKYITVCLCDIVKVRKIKRESLEEAIPQGFLYARRRWEYCRGNRSGHVPGRDART